jgi:hypothetical protein
MDVGARATQEQLPVGRLSPCPAGARIESDYYVMIQNKGIAIDSESCLVLASYPSSETCIFIDNGYI